MRLRLAAAFLSLALLAGCMSLGASGSAEHVAVSAGETARLVNAFRDANGLGPVAVDAALTRIAEHQAEAMAARETMSHTVGGQFPSRIREGGYRAAAAAENIAAGFRTLGEVIPVWEASPGHRANLLNTRVTEFGIGAARGEDGRIYWAIVLAQPLPPRPLTAIIVDALTPG
ncbi:MAG: CAP domain-containing protein [Bauldia sp.]|nr:CAP domain-containing protein [Bauldia sp.]